MIQHHRADNDRALDHFLVIGVKFEKGETNLSEWDSHELWSLSKLAEHLSNAHPFRETPFDFMKDDCFFEYQYDECGFTDLTHSTSDGDKIWIVFVDMHS